MRGTHADRSARQPSPACDSGKGGRKRWGCPRLGARRDHATRPGGDQETGRGRHNLPARPARSRGGQSAPDALNAGAEYNRRTPMRALWCWLAANSSPLTVVLTFLAVVVAAVYAGLTWRLARAARDQAGAARVQAEASRMAANAAADQAHSTRLIFEAAHRPYLQVEMDRRMSFFVRPDFFRLWFTLRNHGPLPAILADRHLTVRVDGRLVVERPPAPTDSDRALFAGDEIPFQFDQIPPGAGALVETLAGVEVDFAVGYRGLNKIPASRG